MAQPGRRPKQLTPQERRIYHAELETCPHCGTPLRLSGHYTWRKTVQTLNGVVYVASRPKECPNPGCPQFGKRYPVSRRSASGLAELHLWPGCGGPNRLVARL